VLGKSEAEGNMVTHYEVSHNELNHLEPIVKTAIDAEKACFQDDKDVQSANWMLKLAEDADLNIDDDLKDDIQQKLSGSKRAKYAESYDAMMKEKKLQMRGKAKGKDKDTEGETNEDAPAEKEETEFSRFKVYDDDGSNKKRRNKEDQKKDATRRKYELNLKKENVKRYANSSYLTPESASYLNSLLKTTGK